MGNTSSNVTTGVKKQADTGSLIIYQLVDLKGGGELVHMLKKGGRGKSNTEMDEIIASRVDEYLYNHGLGRKVPVAEMVLERNKDRPKHKQIQPARGGAAAAAAAAAANATPSPSSSLGVHSSAGNISDLGSSLADINGEIVFNKQIPSKYRECCWDICNRGAVGETILHMCLLNGTSVHADLAKRLIRLYPKIINDIYLSDEYYGENVLHMAIVNEDPAMVKFLLDNGVNYHERCIGNFFSPEDQKMSRTDNLEHEWVDLCVKTNYEGYVYWGEYPLSFAACLGQEECYRLVLAKGADPNLQDTNGNTVLHMLSIYEKISMFDMAFELGASSHIRNVQNLTPLTLSAKLARRDMFMHILKIERDIYWQMGNIVCAAYPLTYLDTIDVESGNLINDSALNLIIYGDNIDHLELMEGVIMDLLGVKWNTFIKFRFYKMFACFFVYFLITFVCFLIRPVQEVREFSKLTRDAAQQELSGGLELEDIFNETDINSTASDPCYLLEYDDNYDIVRWVAEILTVVGAVLYLIGATREATFLGYMFVQNLMTVPSRVLFLFSCVLVVIMIPMRFKCAYEEEDTTAVLAMLTIAPYFLFFCRGFKMVGPFVVMIYRMIQGDLLRFVTIYLVFVLGFSQAFYIIFQSHNSEKGGNNYFSDPIESIMAMFIMSLQEFGDIYNEFDNTQLPLLAKFMFIMYMSLVAILLINMLIAMMGNTYQIIAETRNEWQRQWGRIVLVVERGVSPRERLRRQKGYSQPMADGRLALVLKHQMTDEDLEELKEIREMKAAHIKSIKRREKGKNIMSSAPGSPLKTGSEADIAPPPDRL